MDAPLWLTATATLGALVLGNLAKPLFSSRDEAKRLSVSAADSLRDDLAAQVKEARDYHAKIQAQMEQTRAENERLFAAVVSITTSFNEFQMMMLREAIQVSILLDTKDVAAAEARLDSLIKHIQGLQIAPPSWSQAS